MTDSPSDTAAGQDGAKAYIAAELREIAAELASLDARAEVLRARRLTLWADARRAGVSFARIAAVSGVERTSVFYALQRAEGKADDV